MDRTGREGAPIAGGLGRRTLLGAGTGAALLGVLPRRGALAQDAAVAETGSGRLRGTVEPGVHSFRGVPYAASTAGAGRFLPPRPVPPWAGVRDATAFGRSAPQVAPDLGPLTAWYGAIEATDEDCLSLNVFTPGLAGRRPVMLWIHGGAWSSCAGSAPGFDGRVLAQAGDVVVVTVNHRLNLFGYLRLDGGDERFADSGNAGLLDLVAALRWVRDNAAAFGGDAGNVTIFGQSGGAAKVSALMAAPAARGLFHRAVAQSCSGSLRLCGEDEAARMAHGLAGQLGVAATGPALQAVPTERLVAALAAMPRPFRPVRDGRSFTRDPFEPTAPAVSAGVPFLVGNAADETRLYLAADTRNFSLDAAEVQRRVARFLQVEATEAARILEAYRAAAPDGSASDRLAAVTTDYVYRRNTTREAALRAQSAASPGTAGPAGSAAPTGSAATAGLAEPAGTAGAERTAATAGTAGTQRTAGAEATAEAATYAYVFDWRTPVMGGLLRSPHTSEVPFVFATMPAAAGLVGDGPELIGLSRTLMAAWVAFARSGDPACAALPAWPAYTGAGRATMLLGLQSRVAADPDGARRTALEALPAYEYSTPLNYVRA